MRSASVPFSAPESVKHDVSGWPTRLCLNVGAGKAPRRPDPLADACTAGGIKPGSVRDGPHREAITAYAARARSDLDALASIGERWMLQSRRSTPGTLLLEANGRCRNLSAPWSVELSSPPCAVRSEGVTITLRKAGHPRGVVPLGCRVRSARSALGFPVGRWPMGDGVPVLPRPDGAYRKCGGVLTRSPPWRVAGTSWGAWVSGRQPWRTAWRPPRALRVRPHPQRFTDFHGPDLQRSGHFAAPPR